MPSKVRKPTTSKSTHDPPEPSHYVGREEEASAPMSCGDIASRDG